MPRHALTLSNLAGRINASTRQLNAHLFGGPGVGGTAGPLAEPDALRLGGRQNSGSQEGAARVGKRGRQRRQRPAGGPFLRVHFVAFLRPGRELDDDNLRGGLKLCRDAIADWFGLDDSQHCIAWEYSQTETRGREGIAVRIEPIAPKS